MQSTALRVEVLAFLRLKRSPVPSSVPGVLVGRSLTRASNSQRGDDAGDDGYVVSCSPFGISRAVVLLVVSQRDDRAHAQITSTAAFEDVVAACEGGSA